jgi:hypothetical protein
MSYSLQTAIEVVLYYCLESFLPDGGNNNYGGDQNGPDLWVNCGDFNRQIDHEIEKVSKRYHATLDKNEVDEIFANHGLHIEKISPDETIVHLIKGDKRSVTEFYTVIRPKSLKELKDKIDQPHVVAKRKFGLL